MTTLQSTALQKAIALLTAAGARYCVIAADGTKHGTLEVAPERARKSCKKVHNHKAKHGYLEKLRAAKVGDVLEFVCDTKHEANSLCSSMSSYLPGGAGMTECKPAGGGKFFARCLVIMPMEAEEA
jgi:hypothetical protein